MPAFTAISLVIITHNSASFLGRLAASLPSGFPFAAQITLADSGSSDQTVSQAREHFPTARILELANRGFGAAANSAVQCITTPWFLLCNADLEFAPDFFSAFFSAAESHAAANPEIACFAPTLLNADGSPQPSVGRFPTIRSILRDQFRPRALRKYCFPQPARPARIDWATAACLLLRRDAFLRITCFDEKYFLYMEDVDLQFRLQAAGFQSYFVPLASNAAVKHLSPNAARPPRQNARRHAARGTLRYFATFGSPLQLLAYRALVLLSCRLNFREALASRKGIRASPCVETQGPNASLR